MARKKSPKAGNALERFSRQATVWSGSSWAFIVALATIVVWGATGPIFHYSDTWQLVINTGTTIVTFLMVFLIQRAQNKESLAVQLKLDEIVASLEGASNRLIDVENLSEAEVENLHKHYEELGRLLNRRGEDTGSHSIDAKGARRKSTKK
jgi:low affinity Fe/Cu permease